MTVDSELRSSSEIREQLADLDKVRVLAEEYGVRDFASQMQLASILGHRDELLAELRAAEQAESQEATTRNAKTHTRLRGTLVGGSLELGRFELRVGDNLVTGDIAELAKNGLRNVCLGADVEAEMDVTPSLTPDVLGTGPRYVLRAVHPVVSS